MTLKQQFNRNLILPQNQVEDAVVLKKKPRQWTVWSLNWIHLIRNLIELKTILKPLKINKNDTQELHLLFLVQETICLLSLITLKYQILNDSLLTFWSKSLNVDKNCKGLILKDEICMFDEHRNQQMYIGKIWVFKQSQGFIEY